MYILANTFFHNIMRQFFFNIDKIVFGLISRLYDLLIVIARTSPLSQGDITEMAGRIYSLLAIFMIFKVTFSLIMYVVNPDDFTEKSKGVGNLTKNIILSLALLVLTPFLFRYAYQLQEIILEDNSLAALVFGDKNVNNGFINSAGEDMAYTAISPFFVPDTSIEQLSNCSTLVIDGKFNPACSGIDNENYTESTDSNVDQDNTMLALTKLSNGKENSKFKDITLKNYVAGVNNASMGLTFRMDMALATFKEKGEDRYVMDYSYFVSTAVGIVIALLLVSFCMDIGVRSIKLAFLQLIAPIPIISYVDPKSGKDGMFKKWYKMCFSTFISLFVRLLVIYFAVYIISKVANHKLVDVIDGSYVTYPWLSLFIMIGALMFAKQFPKILESLGIKLDGGGKFTLNPLKKIEDGALGGKRITGAAGALVSGVADRFARIATAPGLKGKATALLGAGPGLLGAAARGFSANQGYKGGKNAQNAVNRRLREGRINGLSPVSSYLDYVGSKYGLDDATLEREATFIQRNDDELERVKGEIDEETRSHTRRVTDLTQGNAVRKDTQSKFANAKAKADAMKTFSEEYTKKKANFGRNTSDDAYLEAMQTAMRAGTNPTVSQDIILSDGSKIVAGTKVDASIIGRVRQSASKDYARSINENNYNLQLMQNADGGVVPQDMWIGAQFFRKGDAVDGTTLERARQAAYDYEKYATERVQDAFATGSTGADSDGSTAAIDFAKSGGDGQKYRSLAAAYESAAQDANDSVSEYNRVYGANITGVDAKITGHDSLDSVIKTLEYGDATSEMIRESERVERQIADENRIIEQIKHSKTVDYVDENGHVQGISIDDAESQHKSRKERHQRILKRHQQRRSLFTNSKS